MADILYDGKEIRANMGEARTRLTDLVDMALTGTTVLLMRRNAPIVQLVPVPDYSHSRHAHPDDVSCYAAGPAGHPVRISTEGTPEEHARARQIAEERGLWQPPPPPPPEERLAKPPKPPRNREVASDGHASRTETAKTLLQPPAAVADPMARQRNIDSILNNLGGRKRKG